MSVKALTRTAKERRAGSLGFAEAMMIAYNFKCKYKLSLSRLYSKGDYEPVDDDFEEEERLSIFDNDSMYEDSEDL